MRLDAFKCASKEVESSSGMLSDGMGSVLDRNVRLGCFTLSVEKALMNDDSFHDLLGSVRALEFDGNTSVSSWVWKTFAASASHASLFMVLIMVLPSSTSHSMRLRLTRSIAGQITDIRRYRIGGCPVCLLEVKVKINHQQPRTNTHKLVMMDVKM